MDKLAFWIPAPGRSLPAPDSPPDAWSPSPDRVPRRDGGIQSPSFLALQPAHAECVIEVDCDADND